MRRQLRTSSSLPTNTNNEQDENTLDHPAQKSRRNERATVRINVNLPEHTYNELDRLADEAGITMSEFVRNALRTYNTIKRERLAHKRIYIGTNERVEKELVIP